MLGGRKSTLRKLEWLLDYIPKCFYMCTCHGIDISDENTAHLFYYVAVPLAVEEDPIFTRAFILNSFSNGFNLLILGISSQLMGLPCKSKQCNLQCLQPSIYWKTFYIYCKFRSKTAAQTTTVKRLWSWPVLPKVPPKKSPETEHNLIDSRHWNLHWKWSEKVLSWAENAPNQLKRSLATWSNLGAGKKCPQTRSPQEFGELANSVAKPSPELASIVLFLPAHSKGWFLPSQMSILTSVVLETVTDSAQR